MLAGLDFPLVVTLARLFKRTFQRWWYDERLFGTNCTESLYQTFCTRESIFWWCVSQHWNIRRYLSEAIASEEPKVAFRARFRWPSEVENWVQAIEGEVKRD